MPVGCCCGGSCTSPGRWTPSSSPGCCGSGRPISAPRAWCWKPGRRGRCALPGAAPAGVAAARGGMRSLVPGLSLSTAAEPAPVRRGRPVPGHDPAPGAAARRTGRLVRAILVALDPGPRRRGTRAADWLRPGPGAAGHPDPESELDRPAVVARGLVRQRRPGRQRETDRAAGQGPRPRLRLQPADRRHRRQRAAAERCHGIAGRDPHRRGARRPAAAVNLGPAAWTGPTAAGAGRCG